MNMPERIERLPIVSLVAYAKNARTHSSDQVGQIAASLWAYGFTNPVLIDGEGGIIAGHGRVMAALQIGLKEVPCIRLGHLTEAQKRAYIIADNAIALNADWDMALLRAEVKALDRQGIEFEAMGLTDEFMEELFKPGQMAASFDRGLMEETGDDEPPSQNEGRYPVTVLLDEVEFAQWDALKAKKGLSDKRLLLQLMEGR